MLPQALALGLLLLVLSGCMGLGQEVGEWLDFLVAPHAPRQSSREPYDEEDEKLTGIPARSDEQEAVAALNALREQADLSPLAWNPASRLQQAARLRAFEISRRFSHTRPDGRDCASVLEENGIRFRATGENIAYGSGLGPVGVTKMWEKSQGHRRNMLNATYREVGLAAYSGRNGQVYWVQIFLRR